MFGPYSFISRRVSLITTVFSKMPKPKLPKIKGGKIAAQDTPAQGTASGPVSVNKKGNIAIKILAKPGAKNNGITGITDEGIGVQIDAPPVEGEANTSLLRYLADIFGLRKSDVSLDKGMKSRHKTVVLESEGLTVEKTLEILQAAKDKN